MNGIYLNGTMNRCRSAGALISHNIFFYKDTAPMVLLNSLSNAYNIFRDLFIKLGKSLRQTRFSFTQA